MWGLRQRKRRWPTADDNIPINMAAAAAGNGPLAPHMLSEIRKRHVGSIGYDGPIKRICILPARRWYKSQKHSGGKARFIAIFAALPERFRGFRPAHRRRKACSLDRGIVSHLSNAFPVEFLEFYVVLGGHFWRRRPWWWCWLFSYYRSEKVLNPP